MKTKFFKTFLIIIVFLYSCENKKAPCPCENSNDSDPVVIYKTRNDYSNNVSVLLSDDKKSIIAYPAPTDVAYQKPVKLINGYYLKRMVGNAFLSITIDDYMNSNFNYSPDDLIKYVIDADPFLEIYNCSKCLSTTDVTTLNDWIRNNKLGKCQ